MDGLSRRALLRTAGAAAGTAAIAPTALAEPVPGSAAAPQPAADGRSTDLLGFFNAEEARFVRAAVDRLIPADDRWGGAEAAGVLYYIDQQLGGAYGAGARMYLKGPWAPDAPPQQGYQQRHSPADLYRTAIGEIRSAVRQQHGNREFWDLSPDEMDKVLSGLETGELRLASLPGPVFFETLLANTIEGYFGDPAYGGNRGMISWRMIGFPGAYAQYVGLVDQFGFDFAREPVGIAGEPGPRASHEMQQHAERK
jgi:gluconate 2-dehydrogenase gamma chain